VRYFDVARSYGKSEEFLAGWLENRGHTPQDLLVGSKWGYYYTADWQVDMGGQPHEVKEHSLERLGAQWSETQALLGSGGSGFVTLYQIHSATKESGVLQCGPVLRALADMKQRQGCQIGLTLSGVQQGALLAEALLVRCPDGEPLFDAVQATWNLLEQSAGYALEAAQSNGVQVIVKEALANGRLTSRNTSPAFLHKLRALKKAAHQLDTTVDALCLACAMAQPFNAMVLSGAACIEHVESNYKAVQLLERLDNVTMETLLETCRTDPSEYWNERSGLAWN